MYLVICWIWYNFSHGFVLIFKKQPFKNISKFDIQLRWPLLILYMYIYICDYFIEGLNDGTWKQVAVIIKPVCSYTLIKEAQLKGIGRPATRLADMDIQTLKDIDHPGT